MLDKPICYRVLSIVADYIYGVDKIHSLSFLCPNELNEWILSTEQENRSDEDPRRSQSEGESRFLFLLFFIYFVSKKKEIQFFQRVRRSNLVI